MLIWLKPKPKREPPLEQNLLVEAITAKASLASMKVESYGTVRPSQTLNLVCEVRGKIVEMSPSFEEGGFFKRDELLIRIDPRSYELAVTQREKQLKQIDAELVRLDQENKNLKVMLEIAHTDAGLAKANWERFNALAKQEVIASSTLDQAEKNYLSSKSKMQEIENLIALIGPRADQLRAQQELIEVHLKGAHLDLSRTRIEAPFDGWVLEKRVEREQFVNAGTALGRIYNARSLEVEVRIPLKDLKWLGEFPSTGDQVQFLPKNLLNGTRVQAKIIFNSTEKPSIWEGHLKRIKAEVDEKTRTLPLIIDIFPLESKNQKLLQYHPTPGMFVNVELIGRKIEKAYLLPRHAIHAGNLVYIANDNKLAIREVKVLRKLDGFVYVTEGLNDGDSVITTPIRIPKEGMKLRLPHTQGE
ncbi:MAG: efflux RND transporter periplasmic adaptor subunit [Thermodesulfobacteriota bacterium]|nr:efflux RND transporter periplasmic adaptor subunit [Thermodesulfobacteriota bacterium]